MNRSAVRPSFSSVRRRCRTALLIIGLAAAGWSTLPGWAARGQPVRDQPASEPSVLDFVRTRMSQPAPRADHKVLAFYYTWYGRPERHGRWSHWHDVQPRRKQIATSTNYPELGAYDSYDPAVIDQQIRWAQQSGIDTFICTWWGPGGFDDRAFRIVLDRAAKLGFQVTVYWETAPGQGTAQVDRAVNDLTYVVRNYGAHPAFLRVGTRPVIFVYGRVMGQVATLQWPRIMARLDHLGDRRPLLIADGYQSVNARVFDGVHTYNICSALQEKPVTDIQRYAAQAFPAAVRTARQFGRISCLTVIPGYDDRKIREPGIHAPRHQGSTYDVLWQAAIKADPDWVLITSWNEWHEGSEIEPSAEYGHQFLTLTKKYAEEFKREARSRRAAGGRLVNLPAGALSELRSRFGKTRIAVLPDLGGAAPFWLLDAGLSLDVITWEQIVRDDVLRADRFPILLYAAQESYRQTVDHPRDVDRKLRAYLAEGGTLLVMSGGPLPFYYNEQGKSVHTAPFLGLPVTSGRGQIDRAPTGWETPPPGLTLTFEIDRTRLASLPAKIPFTSVTDPRWRPATRQGLAEQDDFLSLATLRDQQGRDWGSGIAYIDHRASPPQGGKVIYVWHGMWDLLDRDRLMYALLKLAAQGMNP